MSITNDFISIVVLVNTNFNMMLLHIEYIAGNERLKDVIRYGDLCCNVLT